METDGRIILFERPGAETLYLQRSVYDLRLMQIQPLSELQKTGIRLERSKA